LSLDGKALIAEVSPFLRGQDVLGLADYLGDRWPATRLAELLSHWDADVVKVSATCLGLVGTMDQCRRLADLLGHDDAMVAAAAEHALWGVWMRAEGLSASRHLSQAIHWLDVKKYDCAIQALSELIERCPNFAEAYNQRAIAYYLLGEYESSMSDCRRVLELNPVHFGAQAGMGHCLACQKRWAEALEAYHQALVIHPRLEGIRQSIRRIRQRLQAVA
jgi:tetratricopeptide (TPR) repeat protein